MSQKPITARIQNNIISNIQSHYMTVLDMIHHTQILYPEIPDYTITDNIKMMIEENIISVSVSINNVDLYSHCINPNLIQKIWIYLIQRNYSATYNDVMSAFGMTSQQDIADALGVMVAKNIIIKNKTHISITEIELKNILANH